MGCRILGSKSGGQAVLYCSTTMFTFGPVFGSYQEAERFLDWLRGTPNEETTILGLSKSDPRSYHEGALERLYSKFRAEVPDETL
jgi:hypothetical protein